MNTVPLMNETLALLENIYLLLETERKLLEAKDPDWDGLEENLTSIEGLFKLLPLSGEEWPGEDAHFLPVFQEKLGEAIALRRENAANLQAKINEMGTQIALCKQEKAALLAYTAGISRSGN